TPCDRDTSARWPPVGPTLTTSRITRGPPHRCLSAHFDDSHPDYTNIFRVWCRYGYGSRVPVSIHTTSRASQRARYDTATADLDAPGRRPAIRLCIDLDASWRPLRGVHLGVRRSPVHSAEAAGALAAAIAGRRGFRLVGLMSYEAQIAGLGDAPPGRPLRGALIRAVQAGSYPELLARRGAAVAAVREHADLAFVNGGGTGSVAGTAADPSVTEVTAGSGLYGPTLFDGYRSWRPQPAAFFALSVVRKPT